MNFFFKLSHVNFYFLWCIFLISKSYCLNLHILNLFNFSYHPVSVYFNEEKVDLRIFIEKSLLTDKINIKFRMRLPHPLMSMGTM